MPRSRKPAGLEDQLDAALDGPRGPVAAELGPLLEAADELRASLTRLQLNPVVAQRHLALALGPAAAEAVPAAPIRIGSPQAHDAPPEGAAPADAAVPATRAIRARRRAERPRAWRRRVTAFALAAAAVLTPLVVLSSRTLPGEPLYPVKLTVENARLTATRWSPNQQADLRTRFASTRLEELDGLVDSGRTDQIPAAISALDSALAAAHKSLGGISGRRAGTLDQRLRGLRAGQTAELTSLVKRLPSTTPTAARVRIEGAVERSLSGDR